MSIPKYKEGGHARAARLNLGKPHIMWCPYVDQFLLAVYSWEAKGVTQKACQDAYQFCEYLNKRWTPRRKQ